jgi:predicted XRE-type DNA-binding protein
MKFFNHNNEFKAREKALRALKRTIERRQFDKDKIIELMYLWQSCIQQEVDLFEECVAILNQIAEAEEATKP